MAQVFDLCGKEFGRWLVLARAPNRHGHSTYWRCRCSCGTKRDVCAQSLKNGTSTSCGCFRSENPNRRTHGKSRTREHRIWAGLSYRCENMNCPQYPYYGGRGVKICERWRRSFDCFVEDMGTCPPDFTLERIDTNGDYEPSNCRWASRKEQARNTRRNHTLTHQGEVRTIAEWSEIVGISAKIIGARLRDGWSVDASLTRQVRKQRNQKNKTDCINGAHRTQKHREPEKADLREP